ncbi:hypothetical protein LCGC14_1541820, partial [marine sediment metagenome]
MNIITPQQVTRLATSMIAETRVRIATRSDGRHVSL